MKTPFFILFRITEKKKGKKKERKRKSSFFAEKIVINLQDKSRHNSDDGLFFFPKGIVWKVSAEDSNKQDVEDQQVPQRFVTLKQESKISILTLAYFGAIISPSLQQ